MEIQNLNVTELTLTEKREVNGGVLWEFLAGLAIIIAEDWDNFKRGIAGKPEMAK